MRVIKEIHDPKMKISIFSFNEKWIVKCEAGLCEQTYKFPFEEWTMERLLIKLETPSFRTSVSERFNTMHAEAFSAERPL